MRTIIATFVLVFTHYMIDATTYDIPWIFVVFLVIGWLMSILRDLEIIIQAK